MRSKVFLLVMMFTLALLAVDSKSSKQSVKIAKADKLNKSEKSKDPKCAEIAKPKVKPTSATLYANTPFKPGEKATYEVYYGALYVGDGDLVVHPPFQYLDSWNYMFDAYGKTGDWFKLIYTTEDRVRTIASGVDFSALWFYLDQNGGRIFSKPKHKERYITFLPEKCKVQSKVIENSKEKPEKILPYDPNTLDALTTVFKLRTHDYQIDKIVREPVYTSGKNWWLEAIPIAKEEIKTAAGTFMTTKLSLKTYVGESMQQKGDVFVWIATSGSKPIVKITGDIKVGKFSATLKSFAPGS